MPDAFKTKERLATIELRSRKRYIYCSSDFGRSFSYGHSSCGWIAPPLHTDLPPRYVTRPGRRRQPTARHILLLFSFFFFLTQSPQGHLPLSSPLLSFLFRAGNGLRLHPTQLTLSMRQKKRKKEPRVGNKNFFIMYKLRTKKKSFFFFEEGDVEKKSELLPLLDSGSSRLARERVKGGREEERLIGNGA